MSLRADEIVLPTGRQREILLHAGVVALDGQGRLEELNRLAVLAALGGIDLVVLFDEDTPLDLIMTCHPDVLVKGGDWTPDKIVGSKEVIDWGGSVHSIPFLHERSTTALLKKIRLS